MELLLLGLLAMGLFGGNKSKSGKDKKRKYEARRRREREESRRRYHESLGYYEHLFGQGHP
jgi:hypothetical protein